MREAAAPADVGSPRAGAPVRRLLVWLTLALALPLFALAGVSAWTAAERERARFEGLLVQTARALALAVDRERHLAAAVLDTIAGVPILEEGDLLALDAVARRVAAGRLSAVPFDTAGATRTNTALPRAERVVAGIRTANSDFVARVLAADGTVTSDVLPEASGSHVVAVARRVERVGAPHVLAIAVGAERLGEVLREQQLPEGWVAAVLDRAPRVVARTRGEREFVGTPARPNVAALLAGADEGVLRDIATLDGATVVAAVNRAPGGRFAVAIGAPAPSVWSDLGRVLALPALAGLGLLALGLLAARRLGTRLLRGIASLAPGQSAAAGSGIRELDDAARRLAETERARREALANLAASEARFRTATEAFAGGVYECRPAERRVIRSAGGLRLLGEASDDGTPEWWVSRIHPTAGRCSAPRWPRSSAANATGRSRSSGSATATAASGGCGTAPCRSATPRARWCA